MWLGSSYVAEVGRWERVLGRCDIATYENWYPFLPDNVHQRKNCMSMGPWNAAQDDFYEWVASFCTRRLKFICEFI